MIHLNSYAAAQSLAAHAASKGLTILAVGGTPLSELTKTTTLVGESPFLAASNGEAVDVNKALAASTDNFAHNERFDYFVKAISDAVSGHFAFARNAVTAAVVRVTNSVISAMEGIEPNPVSLFNVEIRGIPEPLQQDSYYESLQGHVVRTIMAPERYFRFPVKDSQELYKLVMTGSSIMDERIAQWLAKQDSGLLANVWARYFTDPEASGGQQAHLDAADEAEMLVINLFARKLQADVMEGSGFSLAEYNNTVHQYLEATSTYLYRAVKNYKSLSKSDVLVYARMSEQRTIAVNSDVYAKWIAAGGKNEILFGALIAGGPLASTVEEIEARKDDFLQAWTHFVNLSNTRFRNASFMRFQAALRNSFYSDLKNAEEQEKGVIEQNSHYIERISALFEQELDAVVPAEQMDIARVVTKLVAKARFFYTDSYKILFEIDEHMKADKTMSVEDAAAMAHVEVVADFVAAQLKLA